MLIDILKSKIHRASVTGADLNYIGSISIDENLMKSADLVEYEKVHVLNVTNGSRLVTYVIKAERHSGGVCINGAAAHHVKKGDIVIIVAYCKIKQKDVPLHQPKIVHVDPNNNVVNISSSIDSIV